MNTVRANLGFAHRGGAIMVWTVLTMVLVLAIVAFALDIGLLVSTKSDLQNSADAAARAAARALPEGAFEVQQTAKRFAEKNQINHKDLLFDPDQDLEIGVWDAESRSFTKLPMDQIDLANAARVTSKLDADRGTGLELLFAKLMGSRQAKMQVTAIAAIEKEVRGFSDPGESKYHPILPFTMDAASWMNVVNGAGQDQFTWNEELELVEPGPDGIPEVNLFPEGNHAPGNRGYIEIGTDGGKNGTLNRQIKKGISTSDLNFHGGSLDLGSQQSFTIGGKPGVRANQKTAFEAIVGEVRVIPLFGLVTGSGNNTQYEIVGWVGGRIMHVDFGGNPKTVFMQPADIWIKEGVIATQGSSETSQQVFVKPKLVD